MKIQYSTQKGATLLIAILVASVILSVGLGVYQRNYKELYFASFWKQTQIAFASADSGLECAMYWDLHPATNYTCFGNASALWPTIPMGTTQTLSLRVYNACAIVEITKNISWPWTTIKSRGYNDACGSTDSRRVERGLRIDY